MIEPTQFVKDLDKSDFLGAIAGKSDLLAKGLQSGMETAQTHDLPPRPYGLLFSGMGFSGVVSDLVKDASARALDIPLTIVKHYQLPHHVKPGWQLLAISYSGETEETLSVAMQAKKRGIPMTAFTTGGRLAEMTDTVVAQPEGFQPRAACGFTWFSVLGYMRESQMLPDDIPLKEAQLAVKEVDSLYGKHVPVEENEAKQIANLIVDKIPQIYATPSMYGIGKHFRGMLNENAKKIADVDLVPECNHNDLTGWGDDPLRKHFAAIFLHHANQNPQNQKRVDYMIEKYQEWKIPVHRKQMGFIETFQDHVVEQARAMQFLDYVSFYTAMLRGEDPSEIREIRGLKQMLRGQA